MTNQVQNPEFEEAASSGEVGAAEDWTRVSSQRLPGFANFRQPDGLAPSERFDWEDAPAIVTGGSDGPFSIPSVRTLLVSSISVTPTNSFILPGDLRRAIPVGSSFRVQGTPPDTEVDGYWTVESIAWDGTDSEVFVVEDIYGIPPGAVSIEIPSVVQCTPHEHAWQATVTDTTSYPIGTIAAGQTVIVRVDRGADQTLTFTDVEATPEEVADFISETLSGGGAQVVAGQVQIFSDTHGPTSSIQIEGGTAALLFDNEEHSGSGQWAALWDVYFGVPASATTLEVITVLEAHWQHIWPRQRGAFAGDPVRIETIRRGSTATLNIGSQKASIRDSASWPIPARTPAVDDELVVEIDGTPITVTLTSTAITSDIVAGEISARFIVVDANATCTEEGGRVYINAPGSVEVTGGTANADLGFPTHIAYGSDTGATAIGLESTSAIGLDDVGFFDDFDAVVSVIATFGGDSSVAGNTEEFDWVQIFENFEAASSLAAGFTSWYEKKNGLPAGTWSAPTESFDEGWDGEWLSMNPPGSWVPPGISPEAALVGNVVEYPLKIKANANRLFFYSETDSQWYGLQITENDYADVDELVVELNARLTFAAPSDAIEFTNIGGAVAIKWDGNPAGVGAIYMATGPGSEAERDVRETIGLYPLPSDTGRSGIAVPSGFYDGDPVSEWSFDDAYNVDPHSRMVFVTEQDPDTLASSAKVNGEEIALFNVFKVGVTNSFSETFDFGGWSGDFVDPAGSASWTLAVFDSALTPQNFEDFEEGW